MVWAEHQVYISRGQVGRQGERRREKEEKKREGRGGMRGGERRETHCTEVKMKLAKDVLSWAKSLYQKEHKLDLRQLQ